MLSPVISNIFTRFRHIRDHRRQIVSTLAADSRRSIWAMVDQGVVSLGNFGVNIILAAHFHNSGDMTDYGRFWLLMEPILFLNSMQQALLIYPFTVRGTLVDRTGVGRMASMGMVLTIAFWPLLAIALLVTSMIAHIGLTVGAWAAAAMLLWQLQETVRRGLTMHLRFRAAVLGDAVSYLGQIAVVIGLVALDRLSLVAAFQAMAITSGIAVCIQCIQVGIQDVRFAELKTFSRDCWSLGRWVAFGNLSNLVSGPLFAWNLWFWAGDRLLGIFYALNNLLRLTNPLAFTITTLIMPNATRALHGPGMKAAKSVMRRFTFLGAIVLLPYFGILFFFPAASIHLAFNSRAEDLLPYVWALRAAVIMMALNYVAIATGAFLNAVERSRWTFHAQLLGAAGVLGIAMPLSRWFDVIGANIGAALSVAPIVAAHIYYISKLSDNERVADRPLKADSAPAANKPPEVYAA